MSTESIDIAIVNYHGADDVAVALQRLGAWPHGTVWLVDNSESAAQAAQLQQFADVRAGTEAIVAPRNLGFGRACNLAFARSASDYFLLLNPDARMVANDALLLAQALHGDAWLGAVSPAVYWNETRTFVMPRPTLQTPAALAAQALATRTHRLARGLAQHDIARTQRQMAAGRPFTVNMLAGAVLMLRRSAVERAGGLFDPAYFMFFEDADLSLRLRSAGFRLAIVPQAGAVHEYRHKALKAELMAQSQKLYLGRHHGGFLRAAGGLKGLQSLAQPVAPGRGMARIDTPCTSATALREYSAGADILALSPSPLMAPAMVRTPGRAAPLDAAEWALLEPAGYAALASDKRGQRRWLWFQKAAQA